MKAAFIEAHGGPEVLKFGEMPDPVAASGEVVIVALTGAGKHQAAAMAREVFPRFLQAGALPRDCPAA